jgi:hypothetical protein
VIFNEKGSFDEKVAEQLRESANAEVVHHHPTLKRQLAEI